MNKCRICFNEKDNKVYHIQEKMFGSYEKFEYFQCSMCGCLQIKDVPENMSKYYPSNYYSFSIISNSKKNVLKNFIINSRNKFAVTGKGLIGELLYKIKPNEKLRFLSECKLDCNTRILDVGCGSGIWIHQLAEMGFRNVFGIDPYIEKDMEYPNGLKIFKKSIFEMSEEFDVIVFNHSFEHIYEQYETLQKTSELLGKNGTCIIRIPTVSSYSWNNYKENWVQADAPRHFFLHSVESLNTLSGKVNFKVKKIVYDSTEFQFWGSEQYIKNISLISDKSYIVNPGNSIFSVEQIEDFKNKAQDLNNTNYGDQASFYLEKI